MTLLAIFTLIICILIVVIVFIHLALSDLEMFHDIILVPSLIMLFVGALSWSLAILGLIK